MSKDPYRYERGNVAVEWYNAGEGRSGDYDADNPTDVNYLRFDFYGKKDNEWLPVVDSSYCTRVPVDTPSDVLGKLLEILMEDAWGYVEDGIDTIKPIYPGEVCATNRMVFEDLSWIDPTWANEKESV
jgi:hypothetical protein